MKERIDIRLLPERIKLIKEICAREGRTPSQLIREAIDFYLSEKGYFEQHSQSISSLIEYIKIAKQRGRSWKDISDDIEQHFGVKLNKNQLKALAGE